MSHETYVIADTHFGHAGVCNFEDSNGKKIRPWSTPEEMDEVLVDNWNKTVRDVDKVYLLGDVAINRRCLPTLGRLKGNIILVAGNHDVFRLEEYIPYFKDIKGCVIYKDYILSHMPVHPSQKERFKGNIHGHLHHNKIFYDGIDIPIIDDWYRCVSVEQIDYSPINFNSVIGG